ncbi:WGR domain-containing protein [Sulfobacillus thermosulfidooxidans]|uniref:WGR domain-containing protein n=1 Tax=Sulfobacillus thermosulfidooxidans TaxID=28034 RepID=UPI0003027EF9|nr:WGR domain-containing protein [Sulfobacillus thermosulfidooxidans]
MIWWHGRRVDPAHNQFRWYSVVLQPTLWATWECWVLWGRIGQGLRGRKRVASGTYDEVLHAAWQHRRRKERRGYREKW